MGLYSQCWKQQSITYIIEVIDISDYVIDLRTRLLDIYREADQVKSNIYYFLGGGTMLIENLKKFLGGDDFNFFVTGFLLLVLFFTFSDAKADDGFKIAVAEWSIEKNRITVKGKGDEGKIVTVTNADNGMLIGKSEVEDDKWRVRLYNPTSVLCRIRAQQSDGKLLVTSINNATAKCNKG